MQTVLFWFFHFHHEDEGASGAVEAREGGARSRGESRLGGRGGGGPAPAEDRPRGVHLEEARRHEEGGDRGAEGPEHLRVYRPRGDARGVRTVEARRGAGKRRPRGFTPPRSASDVLASEEGIRPLPRARDRARGGDARPEDDPRQRGLGEV